MADEKLTPGEKVEQSGIYERTGGSRTALADGDTAPPGRPGHKGDKWTLKTPAKSSGRTSKR